MWTWASSNGMTDRRIYLDCAKDITYFPRLFSELTADGHLCVGNALMCLMYFGGVGGKPSERIAINIPPEKNSLSVAFVFGNYNSLREITMVMGSSECGEGRQRSGGDVCISHRDSLENVEWQNAKSKMSDFMSKHVLHDACCSLKTMPVFRAGIILSRGGSLG